MKTVVVISFLICLTSCLFGQDATPIKKGNFLAGGSLSIDRNNYDKSDPNVFPYGPYHYVKALSVKSDLNVNYLIYNNFSLGITFESLISSSKERAHLNSEYTKFIRNDFFIGPVIRWYVLSGFYISSSAEIGSYHYDLKENPKKWSKFLFSTGLGYTAFLGKSVAIEPALKYYHQNSKAINFSSVSEKYNGLQFSVGVQICFNISTKN